MVRRTQRTLRILHLRQLIPPSEVAHELVAGAESDDGYKREEEGDGPCDAPLAEDDAEVGGVPGKEHLFRSSVQASISSCSIL